MTFDEMLQKVLEIFPNAQADEDNEGQLVIYTDRQVNKDGNVVQFVSLEDEIPDDDDEIVT